MTVASHGNHLNRREGEILAEIGGFCAYTPRSALLAEERPPRLEAAVDAGTYAVLGTDGLSPSVRGGDPLGARALAAHRAARGAAGLLRPRAAWRSEARRAA